MWPSFPCPSTRRAATRPRASRVQSGRKPWLVRRARSVYRVAAALSRFRLDKLLAELRLVTGRCHRSRAAQFTHFVRDGITARRAGS